MKKIKNLNLLFGVLLVAVLAVGTLYFYPKLTADYSNATFTSPYGTVTYNERGGVGPQTSREILLAPKLTNADLDKDTSSRDFIIKQTRETATIFIEKQCLISPIAIAWKKDLPLKFSNEDSVAHTISLLSRSYTVASNQTLIMPDQLPKNTIIKLNCDKKIAGYLYFIP